jgi:hypothetical protein
MFRPNPEIYARSGLQELHCVSKRYNKYRNVTESLTIKLFSTQSGQVSLCAVTTCGDKGRRCERSSRFVPPCLVRRGSWLLRACIVRHACTAPRSISGWIRPNSFVRLWTVFVKRSDIVIVIMDIDIISGSRLGLGLGLAQKTCSPCLGVISIALCALQKNDRLTRFGRKLFLDDCCIDRMFRSGLE